MLKTPAASQRLAVDIAAKSGNSLTSTFSVIGGVLPLAALSLPFAAALFLTADSWTEWFIKSSRASLFVGLRMEYFLCAIPIFFFFTQSILFSMQPPYNALA